MSKFSCCLCQGETELFYQEEALSYQRCQTCALVFVPEAFHLESEIERQRYFLHQESYTDQGYRHFVGPLMEVLESEAQGQGLDFGCGRLAVLAHWLREQGKVLDLYDLYFHPRQLLPQHYDYIVTVEVVEHFRHPQKEFARLKSLLKAGGKIFIQTQCYPEELATFARWGYRRDPTHITFYHPRTFAFLAKAWGVSYRSPHPQVHLLS